MDWTMLGVALLAAVISALLVAVVVYLVIGQAGSSPRIRVIGTVASTAIAAIGTATNGHAKEFPPLWWVAPVAIGLLATVVVVGLFALESKGLGLSEVDGLGHELDTLVEECLKKGRPHAEVAKSLGISTTRALVIFNALGKAADL